LKVLYVSHTAEISGGERSLLSLLAALPDGVQALVATPDGPLASAVAELGVQTTPIAGTTGSLRLHPLHTPRALAELGVAAAQLRRTAHRHGVDVVHANSIRAGVVLGLARPPCARVVHVRDCLPASLVASATLRLIASTATVVVANSRYTADSVGALAPRARLRVAYSPVDVRRFDDGRIDRTWARERLGQAGERRLLLGVVAQLTPWKGQDTAVQALELLCREGVDAHLLLIGSAKFVARATRFDNRAYVERLHQLVGRAGLRDRVSFMGEREDVPELIRALDVLLAPSWEEPLGRSLLEAMALSVPVIATNLGGPPEIVRDGQEGFLVEPRDPGAWAAAIGRLAEHLEQAREMGRAGRLRVEQAFTVDHHLATILDVYEQALAEGLARAGERPRGAP
jgi:L-malate glycosyltransferase